MATIKDLLSWVEKDITRFGTSNNYVEFISSDKNFDLKFRIYTDINQYSFVAREEKIVGASNQPLHNLRTDIVERSYLGCTSSCRKPRAGEDWTRGSDLADGELSIETWYRILGDIISYELVKIHR